MSTELYVDTATRLRLSHALERFQETVPDGGAAVLLYTPRHCLVAHLATDGVIRGSSGKVVDPAVAYEARIFHDQAELRWLNDPTGQGEHRMAILSERPLGTEYRRLDKILSALKQTYLLWGTLVKSSGEAQLGWSRLAEARIGAIHVPVAGVPEKGRVLLHTVEYLAEYEHGNVAVIDERLLRLEADNA